MFAEYEACGIPRDRMIFSPYCVDNAFFSAQRDALRGRRDAIRREYGFSPETFVIGYVGKLYPHKNPLELINAVAQLNKNGRRYGLLMVGDGPLRLECERLARTRIERSTFPGFLNQTELGSAYTAMDTFVMPSVNESWGLTLNESLVFRLPAIATTGVNAAKDLIHKGQNGYTYSSGDGGALATLIGTVAAQVAAGIPLGERSGQIIQDYTADRAAEGIADALRR